MQSVISLKKYLDSDRDELVRSALDCYRAALRTMGSAGAQACPPVGSTLKQSLAALQQKIAEATPARIEETQAGVEKELQDWAQRATDYYKQRTSELKELLLVIAGTAEAVGERDSRYQVQFQAFSAQLSKLADLQDLTEIRSSLLDSAAELKHCVQKMAEDGKQAVAQLRAEVAKCQTRIQEVERIAVFDPLTGLANRRGIETALEFRLAQGRSFSLMLLDLNEFKQLNDLYGHLAGDQVLQQFAAELKAVFRATDSVGRWGGDEFVVVLDVRQPEADEFANRVKKWVFGEYSLESAGVKRKVHVDAALGVTQWQPHETLAELLERADRLMYEHKNSR